MMTIDDPTSYDEDTRIDHGWDAIVRGDGLASKLAPAAATTIYRIHEIDDAPFPRAAFVAALEAQLLSPTSFTATPTRFALAPPFNGRTAAAVASWRRVLRRQPRRCWPLTDLPTAILLLLLLATSFAAYRLGTSDHEDARGPGMAPSIAVATPTRTFINIPGPDECTADPRSVDPVRTLLSSNGTAVSGWYAYAPVAEELVSTDTIVLVKATVRQVVACLNLESQIRRMPPVSGTHDPDDFVVWEPSWIQDNATPMPAPVLDTLSIISVEDIRLLGVGVASARVILATASDTPVTFAMTWVFEGIGDRLVVTAATILDGLDATPTPTSQP